MPLRMYRPNSADSAAEVGLRFQVSSFGPLLYVVSRKDSGVVGAFATHIDVLLGCGESDALAKIRTFSEYRFVATKAQEPSYVHVGMGVSQ